MNFCKWLLVLFIPILCISCGMESTRYLEKVVKDSDSFASWFNSGNVNLSCATGTMHIAFKYTGGGLEAFDGIYELDEISVDYDL